jgi:hypothetical protein
MGFVIAQQRPCRLSPEPLRQLNEWTESYRQFWADSFDRLDKDLNEIQRAKHIASI